MCWLCTSEVYKTTIYTISYYLTKRKDKDENSTK
nr:MAG TPA: outer capsid protein sigma-1 attachment protein [Caudoviricetes sp.]